MMKVKVSFSANDRNNICENPEVASVIAQKFASPWLPWGKEKSESYIEAFAKGAGCKVRLHFDFSLIEAQKYDYFVLSSRHVVSETEKVANKNMDYADSLQGKNIKPYGNFKIREKVFVDKIKPSESRIWSMEFCEAYIVEDHILEGMNNNFTGISKAELLHYKTEEKIKGWSSFYSESLLPEIFQDETTFVSKLDDGSDYIETHGLWSASTQHLEDMPDVFRLPQVYNNFGDSLYVVRKSVIEYWFSKGIKKSFFLQPLLVLGTEQHDQYLELWRDIKLNLSVNPKNLIV